MPAPFHSRLASPASAPAGGSSMTAVTPSSRMVARHASKRTGLVTWLTRRFSASAPVATAVATPAADPRSAEAVALSAAALRHFLQDEHEQARELVERALALDPQNRKALELEKILRVLG